MNLLLSSDSQAGTGQIETTEEHLARLTRENEELRKDKAAREQADADAARMEELIAPKVAAGLKRAQAIASIEAQKKFDAHQAKVWAECRGPILKILKKHKCVSFEDVTREIRMEINHTAPGTSVEEIKAALRSMAS